MPASVQHPGESGMPADGFGARSARRFPLGMLAAGGRRLVLVLVFVRRAWRRCRTRRGRGGRHGSPARCRCRTWRRTLQRAEQGLAVRAAQAGTGVPARAGRVAAVVALGYFAEALSTE